MAEMTHDEKVQILFNKLSAKQAEVANAEKPQYITDGNFRYSEGMGNTINIVTELNERKLVDILAFLKGRTKDHTEAANELGVVANFTWLGFTQEEWSKDLRTRISVLRVAERRSELADLEIRIFAVVSPVLRQKVEMALLEALLG